MIFYQIASIYYSWLSIEKEEEEKKIQQPKASRSKSFMGSTPPCHNFYVLAISSMCTTSRNVIFRT